MGDETVWLDAFTAIRIERLPNGGANVWERADPVGDESARWLLIGYADPAACRSLARALCPPGDVLVGYVDLCANCDGTWCDDLAANGKG